MQPQVVVVGSFVQDLTWQCDAFPRTGETVIGRFVSGPGGKGSNQAVACARTGTPTAFIGAVGSDVFAASAKKFHGTEGITARFAAKPRHATATAAILVNASGQNQIIVALGASAHLAPRDVDAALIRRAKVVVCQHEANLPINAHVFRLGRNAGAITILNPAPMRADFDATILPLIDVLIPNESEFVALVNLLGLAGRSALTKSKLHALNQDKLHALCRAIGVPAVLLTLAERGCFVSQGCGYVHLPAHAGMKVVDTAGAGDAFVGGFAAGLVRFNRSIYEAARFGNSVAALSVTKSGTAPSMPTAREIARFLNRK